MGYSNDLRIRVIQVVEGGAAARAAARQFVIGDATAIRWAKRWREAGSLEAKTNQRQRRSPVKKPDGSLPELARHGPQRPKEGKQTPPSHEREQKTRTGAGR